MQAGQFVKHERENDGNQHVERDFPGCDDERVQQRAGECGHGKQRFEILPAHPFGGEEAFGGQIFFEGDQHARHGDVAVNKRKRDGDEQHQIQRDFRAEPPARPGAPKSGVVHEITGFP